MSGKYCRMADEARAAVRIGEQTPARVLGVGRDAENAKALVLYHDKEPSDDDLRRTHDLLRSNVVVSGAGTDSAPREG